MKSAFSVGFLFFVLFGYYAYAFYTGSYLITEQVKNWNSGKTYTSGDILSCFFGIMFGVFSLGMASPNIKAVTEGRVAGKQAYKVIERTPRILLDDPNAKPVGDIHGKIEFRNVTVRYPTRPEQKILDDFTCTF